MHTKNIPADQWRTTFDDLSRAFDGAMVSVEIVGEDVGAQAGIVDQPLRGISADRSGVTIRVAKTPQARLEHHIGRPHGVRIVETDEGAVVAVEIEATKGTHTLLHFRSPMRPELFDHAVE